MLDIGNFLLFEFISVFNSMDEFVYKATREFQILSGSLTIDGFCNVFETLNILTIDGGVLMEFELVKLLLNVLGALNARLNIVTVEESNDRANENKLL